MQRCENGGTERGIKTEGCSPAPTVTGGHHQRNTHRYMSVCMCVSVLQYAILLMICNQSTNIQNVCAYLTNIMKVYIVQALKC